MCPVAPDLKSFSLAIAIAKWAPKRFELPKWKILHFRQNYVTLVFVVAKFSVQNVAVVEHLLWEVDLGEKIAPHSGMVE